jgi:hypothetical protein
MVTFKSNIVNSSKPNNPNTSSNNQQTISIEKSSVSVVHTSSKQSQAAWLELPFEECHHAEAEVDTKA